MTELEIRSVIDAGGELRLPPSCHIFQAVGTALLGLPVLLCGIRLAPMTRKV